MGPAVCSSRPKEAALSWRIVLGFGEDGPRLARLIVYSPRSAGSSILHNAALTMGLWNLRSHLKTGRKMLEQVPYFQIEIPYPHQTLNFGQTGRPLRLQFDSGRREELKQAVRVVLAEYYGQKEGGQGG